MGDTELSKALKDLPNRVLNVPVEERQSLIENVCNVLPNPGFQPALVKGICKVIGTTLTKYKDVNSQNLIKKLISALLNTHCDLTIEHMNAVLKAIISKELPAAPVLKSSQASVIALSWSLVLSNKVPLDKEQFNNVVETQSQLLQFTLAAGNIKINEKVYEMFRNTLIHRDALKSAYFERLLIMEPASNVILLMCLLLRYSEDMDDKPELLVLNKEKLVEHFVKGLITVKVKPNGNYIPACTILLSSIEQNEFKSAVLPALQRSMLRNPELVLNSVGSILSIVEVNVNEYAADLAKVLAQHLHSKDDTSRDESLESLRQLALKCSDAKAVHTIITNLFSVFNGSDGKITVADHRINILQAVGYFSDSKISVDKAGELMTLITNQFVKVLESELHEKVLCHALEMYSLWTKYYTLKLPSEVGTAFKKGLEMKSTTQNVRINYLLWLLSCLESAKLEGNVDFHKLLMPTIEKASNNATQIPLVSEALCSVCLILKTEDMSNSAKLQSFWPHIVDMSKQIYVAEKFMASANQELLYYILVMCVCLLKTYHEKLKGSPSPLYRAIIHSVLHTTKATNQKCLNYIKELLNTSTEQVAHEKQLLLELSEIVQKVNVTENQEDGSVLAESITNALNTICYPYGESYDTKILATNALLSCHHSTLFKINPKLWQNILEKNFKFIAKTFIIDNVKLINELLIDDYKSTSFHENALATISRIAPEIILPTLIEKIKEEMRNPDILKVTDDEYFTFLTPDGELYDKSVYPSEDDAYEKGKFRRENKVYTYKEQLEEIQLRREIEEKRKREGTWKPPKLTPKQQEAIKNQTEKENAIKQRLGMINNKLIALTSMIDGATKGNPHQFSLYFAEVLPCMLQLLKSPLVATTIVNTYYNLHQLCYTENLAEIGKRLAVMTILLHEPRCDLEKEWTDGDRVEQIRDIIEDLSSDLTGENENNETIFQENVELTAPAFCYCFEFLKKAFFYKTICSDNNILLKAIQFVERHARINGDSVEGDLTDLKHPKFMPRLELFKVLLKLIGMNRGRVQTQAVGALIEVANSASGNEYCARASKDEIDCLLLALQSHLDAVRDVALRALIILSDILTDIVDDEEFMVRMTRRMWIAKHDVFEDNKLLAEELWAKTNLQMPQNMHEELMKDIIHPEPCIQQSAAAALVSILNEDQSLVQNTIDRLLQVYAEKLIKIPAKLDQFDREIEPEIDQWGPRRGVAITLRLISVYFDSSDVDRIMQFMVTKGLGDCEEIVHKEMLAAALAIVEHHGNESIGKLLPVFEEFLDKAPNSQTFDNIRQAVVILMGSLARHLDKDDPRINPIVKRLLAALSTPSQQVQEAVANCLPHLMPSVKDEASAIVKKLLNQLVKSEKYGERRGAAYGIAGVVKGLGILSLKQLDIMTKLINHIQEKKNYKYREGALFAFEMLCTMLGRLFEPYIVHVLPHLLQCFGDSSQYVRQAADDTAKVVMGKLSAHGVKLVLPSLLNALDEDSWRTKTASVELLGAMAYCAPKQLSSCLPSIVPKLIEVLGDSHTKVQEAGADALKVIGSVIKNPEIQAIVPILLKALEDPSKNTSKCLQSLLETKFVHFIDAPSLALIMPVVQRAFMDRSTETRKMAAQIIGNMYSLTDQKDLTPYLPNIIPGLKTSLLDPVPEVRAVSARALGAMVKGMGESSFEDLLPWLMQTLTSESSSVDRSGAAQGLSEVVGGLGVEKLHKLMPEIIATAERTDIAPHVKDGYIMMFIYMPGAFPTEFTTYIGQIINPILKALADENEYVRDTALKAGQRIVNLYAETAVTLLLPELEKGLFDDNWRIRFSSVQLLGDLLYRISGVSGKMTTETASEDDNFGTEQSHSAIIRFLGAERRNRVLAGLYMGRSDVSLMVRQAALHVWKVVVTNTPRTLREILPTLFNLLLGCLASTSFDKRQVAARTLGDLVRKLGERVLPEIIPILEKGLNSDQPDQRQGVCIGLSEIMASTSKDMVLTFVNSLVPTVRKALSDPLPEVRLAAAKTFDSLHATVGTRALDEILPSMLNGLSDPDPIVVESTLDGLRQVMAIKSRAVLPYLVPQLTANPVNTKALSILASVAGEALTKYLSKILPALLHALAEAQGTPNEVQELEYCQAVVLSVSDEVGVRLIIDTLLDSAKSEDSNVKKAASILLSIFCIHTQGDYSPYLFQLFRGLMCLMADTNKGITQPAWDALSAITKNLDASQQIAHVQDVRQAVKYATSDLKGDLPGFCLPKGITPLLPIFREAILNGLPEEKESAAYGLGEIIALTSAQSLQPSIVHITGPLIRILGDRFNSGVKAAVLETLAILLRKVGMLLKQFLPQLQTTFLKALHDPNRTVRVKAGLALSELVVIHVRADPLFTEIHQGVKSCDDPAERETMLLALRALITPAGDKLSDTLRKQIYTTLVSILGHQDVVSRSAIGGCLGSLCKWMGSEELDDVLLNHILNDDAGDDLRHGRSAALFVALKECPDVVYISKYESKFCKVIASNITSDKIPLANNGVRAAGYLIKYCLNNDQTIPPVILTPFVRAINHQSNEVKQLLAKMCNYLAKMVPSEKMTGDFLRPILPMLVNGTKEKNGYVKSNSEIALIAILHLRNGEDVYQRCLSLLDAGARDSLTEVVTKVLRKVAIQPIGKEDELDDTLLS